MKLLTRDEMRRYNKVVEFYQTSQSITVQQGCFAVMFTNVGDTTARLDGMIVFPATNHLTALGDSRSFSGHLLDSYAGTLNLSFDTAALGTPVGTNPNVEIVQLYYIFE